MNRRLDILLIEDDEQHATCIIEQLMKTKKLLEKWQMLERIGFDDLKVEWIYGSEKVDNKRGNVYHHFSDSDLNKIYKKVREMKNNNSHTGILMDVILTKEEQERAGVNDFSKIKFSKDILDYYEPKTGQKCDCNIYLTTGLRNFGTLAWGIYGRENMERRYIPKSLIKEYPSRKAIAGVFYWLYHNKKIPKSISSDIEIKELEDI